MRRALETLSSGHVLAVALRDSQQLWLAVHTCTRPNQWNTPAGVQPELSRPQFPAEEPCATDSCWGRWSFALWIWSLVGSPPHAGNTNWTQWIIEAGRRGREERGRGRGGDKESERSTCLGQFGESGKESWRCYPDDKHDWDILSTCVRLSMDEYKPTGSVFSFK